MAANKQGVNAIRDSVYDEEIKEPLQFGGIISSSVHLNAPPVLDSGSALQVETDIADTIDGVGADNQLEGEIMPPVEPPRPKPKKKKIREPA